MGFARLLGAANFYDQARQKHELLQRPHPTSSLSSSGDLDERFMLVVLDEEMVVLRYQCVVV